MSCPDISSPEANALAADVLAFGLASRVWHQQTFHVHQGVYTADA
jgi:hypothetical protein